MQAINQLIFNLLAQRRQVILPGLGTLSTEQQQPDWTAATDMLSLPRTRVVFVPGEIEGETVIDLISSLLGTPAKDARLHYHSWLSEVKKVSGADWIELHGVGMLFRYPNGTCRFDPSEALNRRLNPIKMDHVHLPRLRGAKQEGCSRAAGWWILWMLLLAALLGGGYYAYTSGWFGRFLQTGNQTAPSPPAATPVPEPTVPEPVAGPDTTAIEPPPQTAPVETTAAEPAVVTCHLIAGTFVSRTNAERLAAKEGPQAMILPLSGGRFMVSVGRYATRQEADRARRELARRYPDAWIFEP